MPILLPDELRGRDMGLPAKDKGLKDKGLRRASLPRIWVSSPWASQETSPSPRSSSELGPLTPDQMPAVRRWSTSSRV